MSIVCFQGIRYAYSAFSPSESKPEGDDKHKKSYGDEKDDEDHGERVCRGREPPGIGIKLGHGNPLLI